MKPGTLLFLRLWCLVFLCFACFSLGMFSKMPNVSTFSWVIQGIAILVQGGILIRSFITDADKEA